MPDYFTLAMTVEEILKRKDPLDHHGRNVSIMVVKMAELANRWNAQEIRMLKWGAYIHDIGKIMLDDTLLNFPRRLTSGEMAKIKIHATAGHEIAVALGCHPIILDIVRHHHENLNGSGYPDGLSEEEIPVFARWVRVCDFYDAVRSDRVYRHAMSEEEAFMILEAEAGEIFDPEAVQFLKLALVILNKEKNG